MLISRNQELISTTLAMKHLWVTRTQVCTSKGPFFSKEKINFISYFFQFKTLLMAAFDKDWVNFDTQCELFYRGTNRRYPWNKYYVHLIMNSIICFYQNAAV